MARLEPTVERRDYYVPPLKRASWGAIFGGAFVALGVMSMLGALGLAIGFSTIDPAENGSPSPKALGIGAAVWWLVSGIIALFAGGWAAGRLSGLRRRMEGTLHGVVTWALYTAVATVVTATLIGNLISGAFGVISMGARAAASGAGAVVSGVAGADAPDVAWQEVWGDAQRILRESELEGVQPGELDETREEAVRELRMGNVQAAISTLYQKARTVVTEADRENVVNVLVENTSMNREEARRAVEQWTQTFESARSGLSDVAKQSEQAGRQIGQASAEALAWAGWWTFFYLLLTAIAAGLGGTLGAPRTDARLAPSSPGTTTRSSREPPSTPLVTPSATTTTSPESPAEPVTRPEEPRR